VLGRCVSPSVAPCRTVYTHLFMYGVVGERSRNVYVKELTVLFLQKAVKLGSCISTHVLGSRWSMTFVNMMSHTPN
jgi:hypothetical protein